MEQLLITLGSVNYNASAETGIWDVNDLTAGSLLCVDQDGTAVDMLAPAITTDEMQFAVGRSGTAEISVPIDIDSLKWTKQDYTAPVAKVMYIGDDGSSTYDLNFPTPLVAGDVAGIRIIDKTKYQYDAERIVEVEYVVTSSDTETTVQANLVAAINANTRAAAIVTAAVVSTTVGNLGFSLTAATAGNDFTAVAYDVLEDADNVQYQKVNGVYTAGETTPTATVTGHGTPAQLTELELQYSPHVGNNNSNLFGGVLYSRPTNVVAGATYTQYTLMWRKSTNKNLIDEKNVQQTLVIAIPSGETGASGAITAMDNILNSL